MDLLKSAVCLYTVQDVLSKLALIGCIGNKYLPITKPVLTIHSELMRYWKDHKSAKLPLKVRLGGVEQLFLFPRLNLGEVDVPRGFQVEIPPPLPEDRARVLYNIRARAAWSLDAFELTYLQKWNRELRASNVIIRFSDAAYYTFAAPPGWNSDAFLFRGTVRVS